MDWYLVPWHLIDRIISNRLSQHTTRIPILRLTVSYNRLEINVLFEKQIIEYKRNVREIDKFKTDYFYSK